MPNQNNPKTRLDYETCWKACRAELNEAFGLGGLDAESESLTTEQARYALACTALTKFLMQVSDVELAKRFHGLSQAFLDVTNGLQNPLFKSEKVLTKRGRHKDMGIVWVLRARVCVGIRHLEASGMSSDQALELIVKRHRNKFENLLRPSSKLESSLRSWHKKFATYDVDNSVALNFYKHWMKALPVAQLKMPGEAIRDAGHRFVEDALRDAGQFAKRESK